MPSDPPRPRLGGLTRDQRGPALRLLALLGVIAAGLLLVALHGVPSRADATLVLGVRMPLSVLLAVLAGGALGVAMFPRAATAVLSGLLFGPVVGTACALVAQVLGATIAYAIGRVLGADVVLSLAGPRVTGLADRLGRLGTLGVAWARVLPMMPFALLNYGFGVTRVAVPAFVLGTGLGILPSTIAYVLLGDSANDPGSPAFIGAAALAGGSAIIGLVVSRRRRSLSVVRPQGDH